MGRPGTAALLHLDTAATFPETYESFRDVAVRSGLLDERWQLTDRGWAFLRLQQYDGPVQPPLR